MELLLERVCSGDGERHESVGVLGEGGERVVRDGGAGGGVEDRAREKGGGGGGSEWDYVEADGCRLSERGQFGVGFGRWRGCSGHSGIQQFTGVFVRLSRTNEIWSLDAMRVFRAYRFSGPRHRKRSRWTVSVIQWDCGQELVVEVWWLVLVLADKLCSAKDSR